MTPVHKYCVPESYIFTIKISVYAMINPGSLEIWTILSSVCRALRVSLTCILSSAPVPWAVSFSGTVSSDLLFRLHFLESLSPQRALHICQWLHLLSNFSDNNPFIKINKITLTYVHCVPPGDVKAFSKLYSNVTGCLSWSFSMLLVL